MDISELNDNVAHIMNSMLTYTFWDSLMPRSSDDLNEPKLPSSVTMLCVAVQKGNLLCMIDHVTPPSRAPENHRELFGRVQVDLDWANAQGDLVGWILTVHDYKVDWSRLILVTDKPILVCDTFAKCIRCLGGELHPNLKRNRTVNNKRSAPTEEQTTQSTSTQNNDVPNSRVMQNPSAKKPKADEPSTPVIKKDPMGLMDIADLNMYNSRWLIKGRVVRKSDLRTYSNTRGEGKLFNMDIIDRSGSVIRSTFFNKAADKFWAMLEVNKTYLFSKGTVSPANKKFNTLPHKFEIKFDESATIIPADDDHTIPDIRYDITKINEIAKKEKGTFIDVVAIVKDFGDVQNIQLRAGGEKAKRDLTLVDDTNTTIVLTLWGEKATAIDPLLLNKFPPICLKNVRVGDYNGKKLELAVSTGVAINSDAEVAVNLSKWWNEKGNKSSFSTITGHGGDESAATKTLEEVNKICSQTNPEVLQSKGLFFGVRCVLSSIREEKYYWMACPNCWKKVIPADDSYDLPGTSRWHCQTCMKDVYEPEYKYILDLTIKDSTGALKCSAMGKYAEEVMPMICSDLVHLEKSNGLGSDMTAEDVFFFLQHTEWYMRIGARTEIYMDEARTKYKIFKALPIYSRLKEEANEIIDNFLIPCGVMDFQLQ